MKPQNTSRAKAPRCRSFEVQDENTLMPFLLQVLHDQSRTAVKSFLAHKLVQVNNRVTTQFDTPLKPGDTVSVGMNKSAAPFHHPMLNLLYEDEHLLVVEKASGLLSMGTERDKTKTAYYILNNYLRNKDPRNHIFILHRLDRETSGIMMFAKSKGIQEQLQHNWHNIVLERKYVAVVEGVMEQPEGMVRSYLTENAAFQVYSTDNPDEGQLAITRYKVLGGNSRFSLVELDLETGRKNQIRVHMHDLGHSIIGDRKYGAHGSPLGRVALHAVKLRFAHPVTRREMNFETPIPARFLSITSGTNRINTAEK